MNYKTLFLADKKRFGIENGHNLRFVKYMRKAQCSSGLLRLIYCYILGKMKVRYGLEIPWNLKVGKGLYLGHAFNITINPKAVIGQYCNIHKGVTIGQQNRGKNKGVPTIGNKVWIGVNATIVGNILIGDDVLIAPNAYVNCDVPSHSVVLGNPCVIHHRDNATESYINWVE